MGFRKELVLVLLRRGYYWNFDIILSGPVSFFLEYIETFYLLGQNEAWVNEKLKFTVYHRKWFRFWRKSKAITSLYTATFYGFVIMSSIEMGARGGAKSSPCPFPLV